MAGSIAEADRDLLVDITEDPSEHFPVSLEIFAEHDTGRVFRPSSVKEWRGQAILLRPGQLLIPGSLDLTAALGMCDLREMGDERKPYSIIVAGDLRVSGHLSLNCSLFVGGTLSAGSIYHSADIHHLNAKSIVAKRYLYSEYPGGMVLVQDCIDAPVIFFSCVAWECPKTEAGILHPDFPGAQAWGPWKELLQSAGFETVELDAAYLREELASYENDELTGVVEGWLRKGSNS